ncbi:hypothetical protein [Asticcacaulis solisilvae]|uniref:hypothetical protein n=1 Tax=Asticcacaulis solisilvae TaxID=1217274 RepID=UPI003FD766DC
MFVGHYGVSFAAKPATGQVPLWVLFIAVQWLDFWWSVFILTGVEHARITPGFTEASPLDLYDMPWSHGLLGSVLLSVLLGAIAAMAFKGQRWRTFVVVALAAFSHWVLDFVSHPPDLPLIGEHMKVGLGLREHRLLNLGVEIAVLVAGGVVWTLGVRLSAWRKAAMWGLIAGLSALEVAGEFGVSPATARDEAVVALISYMVIAVLVRLVEGKSRPQVSN